ncbi:MAG: methyl-accepting chemotaxis protein [Pseudomonadales bacterium]
MKSIKAKFLALVTLLTLIVVALLTAISVNSLVDMGDNDSELLQQEIYQIKREELKNYIEIAQKSIVGLVPGQDDEEMRNRLRNIIFAGNGYFFVFDQSGTTIVHGGKPALEGKNLSTLKDTRGTPIIMQLIDRAKSGGGYLEYYWDNPATKQEGLKLSYAEMLGNWGYMVGIGVYIDDIDAKVVNLENAIDSNISSFILQVIVISIIVLIAAAALVALVTARLMRPLTEVAQSLEAIASGDGDLTQRIECKSTDEAGRVAAAFNQFVTLIHALVTQVSTSSESLRSTVSELDQLRRKSVDRLQVQQEQRLNVVEGVKQLMVSANDIAGNSVEATSQAKLANSEAEQGISALNDNSQKIEQLASGIDDAAGVISQLEKEIEGVGVVLNVIQEIAEQTNLLALNAAIEAARAGDQGRGFAVVADEVRALARRTRQSIDEIHNMMKRLEQRSQDAVQVMNTSQSSSGATVENASRVAERLSRLSESIEQINLLNTGIEQTSDQQTSMTQSMSDSIERIAELGEASEEDTKQSSLYSQDIAEQTKKLSQIISKFKI